MILRFRAWENVSLVLFLFHRFIGIWIWKHVIWLGVDARYSMLLAAFFFFFFGYIYIGAYREAESREMLGYVVCFFGENIKPKVSIISWRPKLGPRDANAAHFPEIGGRVRWYLKMLVVFKKHFQDSTLSFSVNCHAIAYIVTRKMNTRLCTPVALHKARVKINKLTLWVKDACRCWATKGT